MPRKYSQKTRLRMVQRMVGPQGVSARYLAAETGIAQSTLSRWLHAAGTLSNMMKQPAPSESGGKPPQEWTAEERLRVVPDTPRSSARRSAGELSCENGACTMPS